MIFKPMSWIFVALLFASFSAGFIDSISGGGGLIQLPALLLAGLPPQLALGTNKFISITGTGTALFNFARGKKIIWKIAAFGLFFALAGSYWGAHAILAVSPGVLGKIILFLLPFAMGVTLMPKKDLHEEKKEFSRFDLFFKVPVICLFIGFYDGFFGPGTGTLFVLAFALFLRINLVHASAVTKVFNFVSNLGALVFFIAQGKVLYAFGLPLVASNTLGGYLGSHLTLKKGAGVVKLFLTVSLVILFVSLVAKFLI